MLAGRLTSRSGGPPSAAADIQRQATYFSRLEQEEVDLQKALSSSIKWLESPEEHDYPAAQSYLSLIFSPEDCVKPVAALHGAPVTEFKANDIFRASGLSLLGVSNYHVEKDRKSIKDGKALSPLLLVRDRMNGKVVVADGYHRLCAIYGLDEDASIRCKIL